MAAGNQQQQVGELDRGLGQPGEARSERVGFQMIDGEERNAARQRQPLGVAGTDDQAADQAGAAAGRDRGEIFHPQIGLQ